MLKHLIFTLALLLSFSIINAQEESSPSTSQIKEKEFIFQPFVIAGFNAAQVEGDDIKGYRKLGANFGGGVSIALPKDFSMGFELLYSMKGARSSTTQSINFFDIKIAMDYIDVPIYASYTLENRLMFNLGLIVNTLVRYRETWNDLSKTEVNGFEGNPLALEFMAGVGFKFTDWFGMDARISYSLTDVNKGRVYRPSLGPNNLVRKRSHNVLTIRALFFI